MNMLLRNYPNGIRWALIGGALVLAWFNRFVQDDAFISFRYAQNLAEGHGLVYNIGERIEGYTNFLWTVCMAPAFLLNVDVVTWCYLVSLLAFTVTLLVTAELAASWFKSPAASYLAIILLATNFSFSSYATGGLETQFGIAWIMLSIWLLHTDRLVLAALCSACAILTRMDAVLILFPFWCAAASFGDVLRGSFKRPLRVILAASVGAIPVIVWMLCRHSYYGAWLPNTFLIKGAGPTPIRGLYYMGLFYAVYGFWLLTPLVFKTGLQRLDFTFRFPVFFSILLWHIYLISVGGDFMEFRMMMPTLPLVMLLVAGLLAVTSTETKTIRQKIGHATVPVLACISLFLGLMKFNYPMMDTIPQLKELSTEWGDLGKEMNTLLGEQRKSVTIGITAAGLVPFYTQMPTLDLLGLNSREIALTGTRIIHLKYFGNRPGHVRIATHETVMASGVNLLINQPWVVEKHSDVLTWDARDILNGWVMGKESNPETVYACRVRFPSSAPVPPIIAWPLSDGRYWLTAYLKPHPAVDDAIQRVGAIIISPMYE